jgi:integrase/recombinase XerD
VSQPRRVGHGPFDVRRRHSKGTQKTPRDWLWQSGLSPDSLRVTMLQHLEALKVRHYSEETVRAKAKDYRLFVLWCEDRGLTRPTDVTKRLLERYQRHLFYVRKPDGKPLSLQRQSTQLTHLKGYFAWLCRENLLPANPAADVIMPRQSVRLPRETLSVTQVEKTLAVPDTTTLMGLRDRALLEVLWATGLRRAEAAKLSLYDVSFEKGTVFVREGKGRKDRVVPLPPRAQAWCQRYLEDVRPRLSTAQDAGAFFLSEAGEALALDTLSNVVRGHLVKAGFVGRGSCHLFRHACATQMLEGGADVRFVQELLGHASLETTQVYTRVTISKLKEVYEACHPAARASAAVAPTVDNVSTEEVLAQLEAETEDEDNELHG